MDRLPDVIDDRIFQRLEKASGTRIGKAMDLAKGGFNKLRTKVPRWIGGTADEAAQGAARGAGEAAANPGMGRRLTDRAITWATDINPLKAKNWIPATPVPIPYRHGGRWTTTPWFGTANPLRGGTYALPLAYGAYQGLSGPDADPESGIPLTFGQRFTEGALRPVVGWDGGDRASLLANTAAINFPAYMANELSNSKDGRWSDRAMTAVDHPSVDAYLAHLLENRDVSQAMQSGMHPDDLKFDNEQLLADDIMRFRSIGDFRNIMDSIEIGRDDKAGYYIKNPEAIGGVDSAVQAISRIQGYEPRILGNPHQSRNIDNIISEVNERYFGEEGMLNHAQTKYGIGSRVAEQVKADGMNMVTNLIKAKLMNDAYLRANWKGYGHPQQVQQAPQRAPQQAPQRAPQQAQRLPQPAYRYPSISGDPQPSDVPERLPSVMDPRALDRQNRQLMMSLEGN